MEKQKDLAPVIIDLGAHRRGELNEGWIDMFSAKIKLLLRRIFGFVPGTDIVLRGTKSELGSLTKVLGREKRYINFFKKVGLNDPKTYQSKYKLDQAVQQFEKATGLKWPLK